MSRHGGRCLRATGASLIARLPSTIATVAAATALWAVLASGAAARSLSTSSQAWKIAFARLDYSGGFGTVECEVTLAGSFHQRTIAKTTGALIGYVTAAALRSPCRRGGATILRETLPWHVQYASFAGTLPSVTSIDTRILGIAFEMREPAFGSTCLARSTAAEPATATLNREGTGSLRSVSLIGRAGCRGMLIEVSGVIGGMTSDIETGAGARLTVTLI